MRAFLAALSCLLIASSSAFSADGSDALLVSGYNLASGMNAFVYYTFSKQPFTVAPGDVLEYDILIPASSTETNGGVDVDWLDGSLPLRDSGAKDQNGYGSHPNVAIPPAKGAWYHRTISMDPVVGRSAKNWMLVFEGDSHGPYYMLVSNIVVRRTDGSEVALYKSGPVGPAGEVGGIDGFSRRLMVRNVPLADLNPNGLDKVIASAKAQHERDSAVSELDFGIDLLTRFARIADVESRYKPVFDDAKKQLDAARSADTSPADLNSAMRNVRRTLTANRSLTSGYALNLVGHAHIDFQWLWEWPETLDLTVATFRQALKFMDEIPDFKFSQSSSGLYRVVEDLDPSLFARIQKRAREGRWEPVGGRVSEGDLNLVSPESHVRQFLLGQRYFREKLGRTATIGFEPDSFGHPWTMPSILVNSGINGYYFCRGGRNKPVFWWQAPNGDKVPAFDDTAAGSWYNGTVIPNALETVATFKEKTGLNTMLRVYGVGNHGGGPTYEQLETARAMQKVSYYPKTRFSTLAEYFGDIEKQGLSNLPVINEELNTVFQGCYTTHGAIKRLNRDAENALTSAETTATAASFHGFPYPAVRFRSLWEDLLANQHHDTLLGSAIHETYDKTREQLGYVVAEAKAILGDATRYLASYANRPKTARYAVFAYNPLGWQRTGRVRIGWPYPPDKDKWIAVDPDGRWYPVSIIRGVRPDNPEGLPVAEFNAEVPAFGYTSFALYPSSEPVSSAVNLTQAGDKYVIENTLIRVEVNNAGLITSLKRKDSERETVAPGGAANRLEIWNEDERPRSAWIIGPYLGHEKLDQPVQIAVVDNEPARVTLSVQRSFRSSTITQYIRVTADSDVVETPLYVDWQEVGAGVKVTPFLKMATDVAGSNLTARYEIPFGAMSRPTDNGEVPALKSADLSGPEGGIAVLNDCKGGFAALDSTMRVSLIRSPADPDLMPDQGYHVIGLALWPHDANVKAGAIRKGFEYNQPLTGARIAPSANGKLPSKGSFLQVRNDTVIPTVMKRAEDRPDGVVLRLFEANGTPGRLEYRPAFPASGLRPVNFLEDIKGPVVPVSNQADLQPWEIRTVEFRP
jgi:alpha-mannosidase